jgi:protein-L-isoaspartate(D-aspartate) O-methyltransferase
MTSAIDEASRGERATELRNALVESLLSDDAIASARVEAAFRTVPRHAFAPGSSLDDAYARYAVIVKEDANGRAISTVSDPHIQAVMLEQAEIRPGMRVLEIGSGGYNAALLSELVGPGGHVTTMDIDPEVTDRASAFLEATGYSRVHVLLADAENGAPAGAPYDRIIVTAGAWDIPPAWISQLAGAGRIVVPLRIRGVTRTVVFDVDDGRLVSRSSAPCGFVPMQGEGAHRERLWLLRGDQIGIMIDDGELPDPGSLDGVLARERSQAWPGVTIGRSEPFGFLFLWFATALPGFARLMVDPDQGDAGLAGPDERFFPFAEVEGGSLAYMVTRPTADDDRVEIGARAFGRNGAQAAEVIADALRTWDRDHRHGPGPQYLVVSSSYDGPVPDGHIVDKRHSRIIVSWPADG